MSIAAAESVAHAVRQSFASAPEHQIALTGAFGSLTYRDLATSAAMVSGRLHDLGVSRSEIVGIWTGRRELAVLGLLAALQAGAVAWIVDPRISSELLRGRLANFGIRWLLVDDACRAEADALACHLPTSVVPLGSGRFQANTYFDEAITQQDGALLLFTSGSTAEPKGVLLSHGNLLANAAGIIDRTGIAPLDRLLHMMPLHHTNGINNQVIAPLLAGASIALMDRFSVSEIEAQVATYRPTYLTGVPTMFSRLLRAGLSRDSLAALRFLRCGSAPISEALHREIETKFGLPLVISYGLSEATCTSLMNPPSAPRMGSVGIPLSGQTVALLRQDSLEPTGLDEEGEICISGPTVMMGYLKSGSETLPIPVKDDWIRTGDLGRRDKDGYVFVTGRLKDVIIRGGENIAPAMLEDTLAALPAIKAAAVVGAPDQDLGEIPIAFAVSDRPISEEAVKRAVRDKLGSRVTPAHVFFVEALPETAIGKVDRRELRRLAALQLGLDVSA